MMRRNASPEIAIVGGGMVGMTLAAATSGAGISTTLIEAEPLPAMTEATYDGRSSAIAYGSQQVLAGIGAWQYLEAEASSIREIRSPRRNLCPLPLRDEDRTPAPNPELSVSSV